MQSLTLVLLSLVVSLDPQSGNESKKDGQPFSTWLNDLKSPDPRRKLAAVKTLAALGSASRIEPLACAAEPLAPVKILAPLGPAARPAVTPLIDLAFTGGEKERVLRSEAAKAARALGLPPVAGLVRGLELLQAKGDFELTPLRRRALRALLLQGKDATPAVAVLVRELDGHPEACYLAIITLKLTGPHAAGAVGRLKELEKTGTGSQIRQAAGKAREEIEKQIYLGGIVLLAGSSDVGPLPALALAGSMPPEPSPVEPVVAHVPNQGWVVPPQPGGNDNAWLRGVPLLIKLAVLLLIGLGSLAGWLARKNNALKTRSKAADASAAATPPAPPAGPCPRCDLADQWDGTHCGRCGYGAR